jgi:hypothetical protein
MRLEHSLVGKRRCRTQNLALAFSSDSINAGRTHEFEIESGIQPEEFAGYLFGGSAYAGDQSPIHGYAI